MGAGCHERNREWRFPVKSVDSDGVNSAQALKHSREGQSSPSQTCMHSGESSEFAEEMSWRPWEIEDLPKATSDREWAFGNRTAVGDREPARGIGRLVRHMLEWRVKEDEDASSEVSATWRCAPASEAAFPPHPPPPGHLQRDH